jgi:AcrR family transcriptional regulator
VGHLAPTTSIAGFLHAMNSTPTTTLHHTLLEEVRVLFLREGIGPLSLEQIIQKLNVSPATFHGMFEDKDDLVTQVVVHDMERQQREHAALFARTDNPVERILLLLQDGIQELQQTPSTNYADIQREHPAAWNLMMDHLVTYSYPQIHELLNDGILRKQFRGDINIELVTKIILEQINLILNTDIFPPSRYNLAEVFRSIYLYYIRGICTDEGMQLAASHFARL